MSLFLSVAGVGLVGIVAFRGVLMAYSAWEGYRHEQEQRRLSRELLSESLARARQTSALEPDERPWNGFRKFVLKEKRYEGAQGFLDTQDTSRIRTLLASETTGALITEPVLVRTDDSESHRMLGDKVIIGRHPDCDVVLADAAISGHHACLIREGNGWLLQDLESTNGTRLDGQPVSDPTPVTSGAIVEFGTPEFRIDLPEPGGTAPAERPQICSFYLAPHDGKPLPRFRPGQYLTFQLTTGASGETTTRCYSLSDWHDDNYYRVTIKRLDPPRKEPEAPPGVASNFFHGLRPGDIVDVKAPQGGFYLDLARERPVVLIGGGIGITPVLSMLNALVATGSRRPIWFFYGVRDGDEHIMGDHLESIASENENVILRVCYSRPREGIDVVGQHYDHEGRVSVDLMRQLLPSNNFDYYICGPGPMMDSITTDLKGWGVPESDIYYESFGPATVKRVAPKVVDESTAAAKVSFDISGKAIRWDSACASILEFAEKHGIKINSGCRAGNCGTCVTAVKEGEFKYIAEPGEQPPNGTCLTCVAVPVGALVLDA